MVDHGGLRPVLTRTIRGGGATLHVGGFLASSPLEFHAVLVRKQSAASTGEFLPPRAALKSASGITYFATQATITEDDIYMRFTMKQRAPGELGPDDVVQIFDRVDDGFELVLSIPTQDLSQGTQTA